jgi:hypothetical protein
MRRTLATILVAGFLVNVAPLMRDGGRGWDPIKIIKKIVRIFVPSPDGDGMSPPKP